MKRIFVTSCIVLLSIVTMFGQSRKLSLKSTADYSQFVWESKDQKWQLVGVASNEYFTGLFFRISANSNQEGSFAIPDNAYISGPFGVFNPIGITIDSKDWTLGKFYNYGKGNKGRGADVVLLFNRIPAGVEKIDYCEPNFISWKNITITDNPDHVVHTNWDENSLRAHWASNKCSSIEGIYYFATTSDKNWWGKSKHTLAVIKNGYQYEVIYLKGSNKEIWKEGDLKATFVATASPGLYKATSWFMENRLENEDFYLNFSEGFMSVYENTSSVTADFLKLYPANDINEKDGVLGVTTPVAIPSPSQNTPATPTASGSGIFVDNKVIATNYHVIEGAKKIEVSIKTGNDIYTYAAKVLSTDKTNDLALIIIEEEKFKGIGKLPFALNSKTRDVGTSIFTMGYPMASYMGEEVKITDGIISSKTGFEGDIVTYQISAPIQPGNSGGPLFDKNGNLIGITNAGIRSAQNVGYAIKGSYLCNLIESAPISIEISENNDLYGQDLTEQIKQLSKYVVFIKIY